MKMRTVYSTWLSGRVKRLLVIPLLTLPLFTFDTRRYCSCTLVFSKTLFIKTLICHTMCLGWILTPVWHFMSWKDTQALMMKLNLYECRSGNNIVGLFGLKEAFNMALLNLIDTHKLVMGDLLKNSQILEHLNESTIKAFSPTMQSRE